jgi:hypothetical protein
VGEQVVIICPSGNLANAIIIGRLNKTDHPHIANTPDIYRKDFREAPTTSPVQVNAQGLPYVVPTAPSPIVGMDEYNRVTGVRRLWLRESGTLRLEIGRGVGPTADLYSSILMDKTQIQLNVENTQLIITKDTLSVFIDGQKAEFLMTPKSITAQVGDGVAGAFVNLTAKKLFASIQNEGLLNITKDAIMLSLVTLKAQIVMNKENIKAQIQTGIMKITDTLLKLSVPSTDTTLDDSGVTMTSPAFNGQQGSADTVPYKADDSQTPLAPAVPPPPNLPPTPSTGNAPAQPA